MSSNHAISSRTELIASLERFPTSSGVYIMKDSKGVVLYVGKANNLRNRVKQYFAPGGDGRPQIPFLMTKVTSIETMIVSSEKEALILENNLIKQHQPKYNIFLKDDKTYTSIKLTKHQWPMLQLVRYKGEPKDDGRYFGPYTSSHAARETLELLRQLFPLRRCSDHELARRTRPCILYQMHRCVAPCVNLCTQEAYDELVQSAVRFLRGHDKEIIRELYRDVEKASEQLEFEKAAEILKTIRQLETTIESQKVDKAGTGDRDVIGLYREGGEVSVAIMQFRSGKLLSAQNFHFSSIVQDDPELLATFVLQHYVPLDDTPHEIILPVNVEYIETLSELISKGKHRHTAIHVPTRGDKRALKEMAIENAHAAFHQEKDIRVIRENTLLELQQKLNLTNYPTRIECFDISNIGGTEPVAAMIVFVNGEKSSAHYRKYKLKTITGPDDYASMREVLLRRYAKAKTENNLPDLLIVDGGKGHLNVALQVIKELNIISIDVISVAKESGRHDKGISLERIFLPNIKDPILLRSTSPVLHLLQEIRDETHRFALTFHRLRRKKSTLQSAIDHIPGIGPTKRTRLLQHFGSVKRLRQASLEELKQVKGLSQRDIQTLRETLTDSTD